MAQYDELTSLLRELLTNRFSPKPRFINGLLGDGRGNVEVPGRPDRVYARFGKENTSYFEIFNVTVPKVNNWPVKIGELPWNEGLTQVVGTNWSAFEQAGWGDTLGSTSPHAPTHEWPDGSPGSDPLNVYTRAIVPGRAYISTAAPTTIYVNSFEHGTTGTLWGGLPGINLQPLISATATGTMRYAGVYLDESANALGVVTGGTTVYTSALEPPRVSFPATGVIPIARVRLYGGQSALAEADIKDARRLLGRGASSSSAAGGWPGADEIQVDGVSYASLADVAAAGLTNPVVRFGEGIFAVDAVTLTLASTEMALVGLGRDATILKTTGQGDVMVLPAGTYRFFNLTVDNAYDTGNCYAVRGATSGDVTLWAYDCSFTQSNAGASGGAAVSGNAGHVFNVTAYSTDFNSESGYGVEQLNASDYAWLQDSWAWGATADIARLGTVDLKNTLLGTDTITGSGTLQGPAVDSNGNLWEFGTVDAEAHGIIVKNSSGGAVAAGDVGYIDSAGEFKTTTTANYTGAWAVVTRGGADTADIYVARSGRVSVAYTGTAPNAGEYLVTSTSAGDAQASATMRPEIFAVCLANGSGGQVSALLVAGTNPAVKAPSYDVVSIAAASDSDFVATIATLPGGATLTYNAPSSGDENNLVPSNTSLIAKMVLHNTTRGTSGLISNCVAGTNTITLTANVDAGWQVGDTITIRSQTNTATPYAATTFYVDFEFVSDLNDLARYVSFYLVLRDTGAAGQRLAFHPYETNDGVKARTVRTQVANISNDIAPPPLPLIQKRFCMVWDASGTGTMLILLRLTEENIASP